MWATHHEGALRREEAALDEAAHARPDRGRLAHGAAAAQQRRARRHPGARRRARRHAVAAHQLARRDATRCRPKTRSWSRSARSRSSPRRPASRTPSTRSAAATSSRRSPTASRRRPSTTSGASTRWAAWSRAIEQGYPQKEIADAAYRYQLLDDRGEKVVVGVNKYDARGEADQLPPHRRRGGAEQIEKVSRSAVSGEGVSSAAPKEGGEGGGRAGTSCRCSSTR